MNRKIISLSLLGALVATAANADPPSSPATSGARPASDAAVPLVVSPAWLASHLKHADLVLLHVGEAEAYRKKHIPGARLVALSDIAIVMQGDGGLHLELPPADDLQRRLEALGLSNRSRVVVYFADEWVSPATRVVLTLDAAGLGAQTGLLDGGLPAWVAAGHAVTAAAPPTRKGKLAPLAVRPIIINATTVVASLGKPGFAVVDARDQAFYDGTKTGGSHQRQHRTGHIAGALSIPYDSVFDDRQAVRSLADLRAQFTRAGVKPGDTVIGYCHIGQQATAMLFAARRLGHPVLLYDGSFEDWSQHASYPVTRTDAPATPATAPERKP